MSYILEALKKSEQERQIGQVPDLSVVQEAPTRTAPRWPRWLLAALLLNVALLAILAWWVWDARMSANVASVPPVPADTKSAQPAPDTAFESDTTGADVVAAAPSSAAAAPEQHTTPAANAAPAPELPEPVSHLPTSAPEPIESVPSAAEAQTQLGPDLEPLPPVDSIDAAATVPRWEDLPDAQRAGLPVPRIDVHVFAQEPERRFVLIDLRKYKQGDTLEDGAVIETILADGIVLSYQGQQYRVDRP